MQLEFSLIRVRDRTLEILNLLYIFDSCDTKSDISLQDHAVDEKHHHCLA